MENPDPPPPSPKIKDGKMARFCPSRGFILDLGAGGSGGVLFHFILSKIVVRNGLLVTNLLRHVIQYGGQQLVGSACPDFGTAFPKFNATNRTCCTPRQSGKIKVWLPFQRCPN